MEKKTKTVSIAENKELIFETGKIARQANGSAIVRLGDTFVFSTACAAALPGEEIDFLPLRVDYQEKFSSAGKSLGGFIKREGRPSEKEILNSRLVDRSLRPMFAKGYYHEVQLLSYVLSYDGVHAPDPLAICGTSAALVLSDIPLVKPVAGVRVGYVDDQFIINPSVEEMQVSQLDLMLAGTENAILMIEGYCHFLSEKDILKALAKGHVAIQKNCHALSEWQKELGKPKNQDTLRILPEALFEEVKKIALEPLKKAVRIPQKQEREKAFEEIKESVLANLFSAEENPLFSEMDIKAAYKEMTSQCMRHLILEEGIRPDGRKVDQIRCIDIETSLLPRTHGSSLFTRGETQALAVCTLGGESMGQRFETLDKEGIQRFYLQYFFPPFSVGEVGRLGPAGRRELGHGKLAERALQSAVPKLEDFPYTIRLESNITESNGSSSMASVCGGSLAMMDAGVPIKCPIAGIAMGLILEKENHAILSDILGVEDALGDMDFKMAGSAEGITAFQMDIKLEGISLEIIEKTLLQAKQGCLHILKKMSEAISKPKDTLSIYAPRIESIKVNPSKIALIIGPGGKQIRQIVEKTGAQIDINDAGIVNIAASDNESMKQAKQMIEGIVGEVKIGKVYQGKVTSVAPFGAFVEILPGKEGLCHISELSNDPIRDINKHVKEGDSLTVRVLDINERGQLKLSHTRLSSQKNNRKSNSLI